MSVAPLSPYPYWYGEAYPSETIDNPQIEVSEANVKVNSFDRLILLSSIILILCVMIIRSTGVGIY